MNPKNQRKVTAAEALEQTRRNRLRSAILESRSGPVLPEDAPKRGLVDHLLACPRPFEVPQRAKDASKPIGTISRW